MSYASAVLADTPSVYLQCDDTSGTTATDSSGNGHNFTYNGTFTLVRPPIMPSGTSSVLLGPSPGDCISKPYAAWMDSADFTIEAWINMPHGTSSLHTIGSRDSAGPRGWQFFVDSGFLSIYDGTGGHSGTTPIAGNTRYHAACTYKNSTNTAKLYLNGALEATFTGITLNNTAGALDFYVGSTLAGTGSLFFPLDGYIDEVAFYNAELTSTRIAAHYNSTPIGSATVTSTTTISASAVIHTYVYIYSGPGSALVDSTTKVSCYASISGRIYDTAVTKSTSTVFVHAIGNLVPAIDPVVSATDVSVIQLSGNAGAAVCNSITNIYILFTPDLSDNEPIYAAFSAHGDLAVTPPRPLAITDTELSERATPGLTMTLSDPVVVRGIPMLPKYRAVYPTTITPLVGPTHIHFVPDPNPVWNPATSGWFTPPPPTANPLMGRWTVDDLPDPSHYPDNYYWLGDPTSADGTASIQSAARQWAPNGSTPHAPTWHSFFPFKPSVRSYDSFLPGGNVVHHPKGVHFNSQYIEHMWMNWGRVMRQPFTWCIAAMIVSYPEPGFTHYILDAGKDPDTTGFPRITAEQCNNDYQINDSLSYRNLLAVSPTQEFASARTDVHTAGVVRGRFDAYIKPMMYWTIFNGSSSYVGAWGTGGKRQQRGTLDNSANFKHQLYVMGRPQGWISQSRASHIMVFEMRYWDKNLSIAELNTQYNQLSSTYKFGEYRAV